jgi:hypothetical protein
MKVLTFLDDAKLIDKVVLSGDTPELREFVTRKTGEKANFPSLDLPDRVIVGGTVEGSDELVAYLAEKHGVDISTLPVYNDYCNGVFKVYLKMQKYVVEKEGGWPGFAKFIQS